jgi:hypothetical protein
VNLGQKTVDAISLHLRGGTTPLMKIGANPTPILTSGRHCTLPLRGGLENGRLPLRETLIQSVLESLDFLNLMQRKGGDRVGGQP